MLSLSLKIRHNAHVEVRWKLTGACILLPPCGSWEVISGHQAEQQKPSLTEPSHCPSLEYLPVLDSPLVVDRWWWRLLTASPRVTGTSVEGLGGTVSITLLSWLSSNTAYCLANQRGACHPRCRPREGVSFVTDKHPCYQPEEFTHPPAQLECVEWARTTYKDQCQVNSQDFRKPNLASKRGDLERSVVVKSVSEIRDR